MSLLLLTLPMMFSKFNKVAATATAPHASPSNAHATDAGKCHFSDSDQSY